MYKAYRSEVPFLSKGRPEWKYQYRTNRHKYSSGRYLNETIISPLTSSILMSIIVYLESRAFSSTVNQSRRMETRLAQFSLYFANRNKIFIFIFRCYYYLDGQHQKRFDSCANIRAVQRRQLIGDLLLWYKSRLPLLSFETEELQ